MEIDLPDSVAEVGQAYERYERALVANDVATLDILFRKDERTIRYGIAENLYGYEKVAAFRTARSPMNLIDLGALPRRLAGGGGPRQHH